MNKKFLFVLSLLVMASMLLSACGGGKDEGPTVVRMWVHTNNAFIAGYEPLIAAYEAEHPNVDIQLENFDYELYLQTLQTAMPAGEEADKPREHLDGRNQAKLGGYEQACQDDAEAELQDLAPGISNEQPFGAPSDGLP